MSLFYFSLFFFFSLYNILFTFNLITAVQNFITLYLFQCSFHISYSLFCRRIFNFVHFVHSYSSFSSSISYKINLQKSKSKTFHYFFESSLTFSSFFSTFNFKSSISFRLLLHFSKATKPRLRIRIIRNSTTY